MRKRFPLAVTLVMVLLMAGAVPMCANAACVNPPSGLVSWWGGDNNALDIVGTNNGTLNGAMYAPGKVGQAFSFDGTDDYFNVPYRSSLDLQGSLTITAWINSTNNSSLNRGIAGKAGGYQIYVEAGGLLVFGFYNGSHWTLLHSSILIPENVWVHVAGTFNSTDGTMQLYINGAPDTSLITAQRLSANANSVKVGGFGSDGSPFSGRVDEVGIFNRALSASEIAAIYNADSEGMCRPSVAPPAGLVSWWSGDNNALDIIGTNNGTLNGATYAPGKVGQALSFDGSDDYVSISDADFRSNAPRTMALWVNTTDAGAPTTYGNLKGAFFGRGNSVDQHLHLGVADGKQTIEWYYGGHHSIQGTSNIADGNWHYLVFVSDGAGTVSLYVDSVLENSGSFFHTSGSTATRFGSEYQGGGNYSYFFNGRMDEVAFFNRSLTTTEITAIYNAGSAGIRRPSVAPPSGLVSWWKGENNANDQLGVNNGTLQGGTTYSAGLVGQAFSFNGVNGYVEVPHSATLNLTSGLTLGTWFNLRSLDAALFSKGDSGASEPGSSYHLVVMPNGSINVALYGTYPADWWQTAAGLVTTGQWYHVATTWDGTYGPSGNVKLYLNGALVQTWTKSLTPLNATTQTLTLGSMKPPTYYHHMDGLIDEPAIFSRALSADEIATIYNTGSSGITVPDTTPDAFNFTAQTDMPTNTTIVSNPITVTGINYPTAISITVGDYQINSGSWTSLSGTVSNGDTVTVRQTSSASPSTPTTETLTIGGVSGAFNVTTAASGDPNASGLIAWWKAEENGYDAVGGNHGTAMNGLTYAAGKVNQAFSLDGVNDYVDAGTNDAFNFNGGAGDFTIQAWIKKNANAGTGIIGKATHGPGGPYSGPYSGWDLGTLDDGSLFLSGVGVWDFRTSPNTIIAGNWYHVAVTKNGSSYKLYSNGQEVASASHGNLETSSSPLLIGSVYSDVYFFNGLIDEVKIYNRALSAAEVSKLAGTYPDAFTFNAQTGVALSTPIESNAITVAGITNPAAISITGGDGQYAVSTDNGSTWNDWRSAAGTVSLNNQIKVRLSSSGSYSTPTSATLTIGGVSGTFSVTTLADTEKPVVTTFNLHTAVSSAMSVIVDAFIATDNDRVSGYLVTDTATAPAADDPGWSATAPATVYLSTAGDNILRAWAKDPAGNVSVPLTATVQLKPVRREPENDYVSLQTAYGEAGSGETIKVLAVTLTENIDLNLQRNISISGGYEDDYAGQVGYSTIQGTLTVGTGSLKVERVIIK